MCYLPWMMQMADCKPLPPTSLFAGPCPLFLFCPQRAQRDETSDVRLPSDGINDETIILLPVTESLCPFLPLSLAASACALASRGRFSLILRAWCGVACSSLLFSALLCSPPALSSFVIASATLPVCLASTPEERVNPNQGRCAGCTCARLCARRRAVPE